MAGNKADIWHLRQHPAALDLKFKKGIKRPDRDNAIDLFLRDDVTPSEIGSWEQNFEFIPGRLTLLEKQQWLEKNAKDVSLSSDAFFPFRDNIDRAYKSGVKFVLQPGGAIRDEDIVEVCNQCGMVMACTKIRLFHH